MRYLLVPGLGNSGPSHWQTHWEAALPATRAELGDWDDPHPGPWIERLDQAIARSGPDTVLIAHSLGCAAVVHWAKRGRPVRAGLLVCPADVDSREHTPEPAWRFAPMPMEPLGFPSLVVASTNDPFCDFARAQEFAAAWGADFVAAGAKGHINSDSALGSWPQGRGLLARLVR